MRAPLHSCPRNGWCSIGMLCKKSQTHARRRLEVTTFVPRFEEHQYPSKNEGEDRSFRAGSIHTHRIAGLRASVVAR